MMWEVRSERSCFAGDQGSLFGFRAGNMVFLQGSGDVKVKWCGRHGEG